MSERRPIIDGSSRASVLFAVSNPRTALFPDITYVTKYNERKKSHPFLLLRFEGLIKRLPSVSELLRFAPRCGKVCMGPETRAEELHRRRRTGNAAARSVLARVNAVANDRRLAKRLGRFQSMQTLDQHEARTVGPHKDWHMLPFFKHADDDFFDAPLLQRRAALDWHINVGNGETFALHWAVSASVVPLDYVSWKPTPNLTE